VPVYEFRCPRCGPFDLQRSMQEATHAAPYPTCVRTAPHSYAVGGVVGLTGRLHGAGRADRERVDRAASGQPTVTGVPAGRRLRTTRGHGH
jgi:putative FmdB family regulatory protein